VSWGLGVRITNRQDGTTQDRAFSRFPIRLGRNSLNDLVLEHGFVSQFHLVIEFQHDKLWIRDLGSTNGTLLKSIGPAPTNQPVELASCGFEFTIVSLDFSVYSVPLDQIQAPQASQRRRLGVTSFLKASTPDSPPAALNDVIEETRSLYANYRATWSELVRAVDAKLQHLTPEGRQAAVTQLTKEFDAIGREPDFEKLCTRLGATPSGSRPSLAPQNLEGVALAGVRDLAFDFCPTAGAIESVDSLVRFLERIQQVMDVFFRAFISLRDGQRQFETDMAVRRTSTSMPSPAEAARTNNDLSSALLDWRNSGTEGIAHVESTLADFMIHQVALLNGVMSGVRTLLVEFSPEQIEKRAQDERFNPGGMGIGPYRYKSLWKTLERIHADFTGEDKQVFSVLFGRQFATAYETYFGSGGKAELPPRERHGEPTIPPGGSGKPNAR
jgi:type VI secretion system protein ImpI